MRYWLAVMLFVLPFTSFGKGKTPTELLAHEIKNFAQGDTAIVFGMICDFCGDVPRKYYIATTSKAKMIIIEPRQGKAKKTFDSTFQCQGCDTIIEYAKTNYKTLDSQLYHAEGLCLAWVTDSTWVTIDHGGTSYFLGIYANRELSYHFRTLLFPSSDCLPKAKVYWNYLMLLRKQWPDIGDLIE